MTRLAAIALLLASCSEEVPAEPEPIDCPSATASIGLPSTCWLDEHRCPPWTEQPWDACTSAYVCPVYDPGQDTWVEICEHATDCTCLEASEACGIEVDWDTRAPVCMH